MAFNLFACDDEKCNESALPDLLLKLEQPNWQGKQCDLYFIQLPTLYSGMELFNLSLEINSKDNAFYTNLFFQITDKKGSLSQSTLCIDSQELKHSTLLATYKPLPNLDGTISLCVQPYEFLDLEAYVKK